MIVVVGRTSDPYSLERHLLRAAGSIGLEAQGINSPMVSGRLTRAVVNRAGAIAWLGRASIRRLRRAVASRDTLILVKTPELLASTSTVDELSDLGHRRILLAPDELSTFVDGPALSRWVANGGVVASFDAQHERVHHHAIAGSIVPFQFAYDPWAHWRPISVKRRRRAAIFIGTWDPNRERVLESLSRHAPIAVAGNYWSRYRGTSLDVVSTRNLYGDTASRLLQAHAIALNVVRPQNERVGNMRSFELPALGARSISIGQSSPALPGEVIAHKDEEAGAVLADLLAAPDDTTHLLAIREAIAHETYARRLHALLDLA